jgi:hypothetical protein
MKPHGSRARYQTGCRCLPCRSANSHYSNIGRARRAAGEYEELVDASVAREHLQALSRVGVGRRTVAVACDVAESTLWDILSGKCDRIYKRTSDRILAVDENSRADRCLVDSAPTRKLIADLVGPRRGYSKTQLAQWLGLHKRGLHFLKRKRITARSATSLERLYQAIERGAMKRS